MGDDFEEEGAVFDGARDHRRTVEARGVRNETVSRKRKTKRKKINKIEKLIKIRKE